MSENNSTRQVPCCPRLADCVVQHVNVHLAEAGADVNDLYSLALAEFHNGLLQAVMVQCDNNQSRAAKILGISRSTLRSKLQGNDYNASKP